MEVLKRGDFVTVVLEGGFGKPRPALIVQSDLAISGSPTITVLPLTSDLEVAPQFRITIEPSQTNGLRKISQIAVDKTMTVLRRKVGEVMGYLDDDTMAKVNRQLALWLGLTTT